jgi:hypothetical protein
MKGAYRDNEVQRGNSASGTARPDSGLDLAVEVKGGSFGPLVTFVLSRCVGSKNSAA